MYLHAMIRVSLVAAVLVTAPGALGLQDQDRARDAVRDGKAKPLETLIDGLGPKAQGKLLDAQIVPSDGRLRYLLRTLDENNRVHETLIDAESGKVLKRD
ncbi:MAG: PepSY domain-containing protein [Geminicoccaceae bacterium]